MCIALVEMHHLDTLSEVIPLLGGKPFYINSNKNFRMTGNIAYVDKNTLAQNENEKDETTIKQKLEKNILVEINVINSYNNILQNIKDEYLEKIIFRIICDEEVHLQILESLFKKYE